MKKITLTQNQVAFVDDEDYEYLNQFKWYAAYDKTYQPNGRFLAVRTDNTVGARKQIYMHRVITNAPPVSR